MKYELKTKVSDVNVIEYLNSISNEKKRSESFVVLDIMKEITGLTPKMWGDKMIGFGSYHYKTKSGCEGDYFLIGFAAAKANNITVYLMNGFSEHKVLMDKLGKHTHGKSCLHLKTLDNIDLEILKELIEESYMKILKEYKK